MIYSLPAFLLSLSVGCCAALAMTPYAVGRQHVQIGDHRHHILSQLHKDRLTFVQKIQLRLDQAQVGLTAVQYMFLALFCGIGMYVVCSIILRSWWLSLPTLCAGILFTERIVTMLGTRNRERFEEGNLRALRVMASSLRTSPSYLLAFEHVANSPFVAKKVSDEYKRLIRLLRGKIPLETAMKEMYLRTGSADLLHLSTIVQVQRELGGDMAKTLDLAASFILRRRQMQRKQRATMSQILSQVNLLSIMPFVFVISLYVNNPRHFDPLVETLGGRIALLGAFLSIFIGGEAIRYFALHPMRRSR